MITVVYNCQHCKGKTSVELSNESRLSVWEVGRTLKIQHHQEKDVFDTIRCPEKPNE